MNASLKEKKKFEYADYLDWISKQAPINNSVQLLILDQKSLDSVKITDEIIENISNLRGLLSLNIIDGYITKLPENIVTLDKLNVIKIVNTPLETLPESIGNLRNLNTLILKDTDIKTLPESIGQLTNLRVLNLDGTDIETLPEELKYITGNGPIKITIYNTPMEKNEMYVSRLRSWPSKFVIEPLPNISDSDYEADIDEDDYGNKTFIDVPSPRGGKTRRIRKTRRTRKTRRIRKTRRTRKTRSRKSRRR